MRALPLFVFISLKAHVKGIYKGTTTKYSHMGRGVEGGGAVAFSQHPLLTEKTKTPIVVNE